MLATVLYPEPASPIAAPTIADSERDEFLILASYAHAPRAWWPVAAENILDTGCSIHYGGAG